MRKPLLHLSTALGIGSVRGSGREREPPCLPHPSCLGPGWGQEVGSEGAFPWHSSAFQGKHPASRGGGKGSRAVPGTRWGPAQTRAAPAPPRAPDPPAMEAKRRSRPALCPRVSPSPPTAALPLAAPYLLLARRGVPRSPRHGPADIPPRATPARPGRSGADRGRAGGVLAALPQRPGGAKAPALPSRPGTGGQGIPRPAEPPHPAPPVRPGHPRGERRGAAPGGRSSAGRKGAAPGRRSSAGAGLKARAWRRPGLFSSSPKKPPLLLELMRGFPKCRDVEPRRTARLSAGQSTQHPPRAGTPAGNSSIAVVREGKGRPWSC